MQKSTNDKNQHMVNEKFILWEVLMKKKLLSLLLASVMVVGAQSDSKRYKRNRREEISVCNVE